VLKRRARTGVVAGLALALTMATLVSAPVAAAVVPASSSPSAMLPDTSAATAGPVVGRAAIAALPPVAQAPARAAAAPVVTTPFLSDSYCSYGGFDLKSLMGLNSACVDAILGSYDPLDNCFWKELQPQPPPGDPLWQGQSSAPPAKLYVVTCETHNGTNIGNAAATIEYSTQPPLNFNQAPLSLAQRTALNLFVTALALAPVPETGTEPPSDDTGPPAEGGVVGLPSWMWTDIPPAFWDQWTFTKKVFLIGKVALAFQGEQVDWDMGDGHHVICATPGSAYVRPTLPNIAYKVYSGPPGPSPDCGYTYQKAGTYGVTSTATWYLAFQVGSTSGTFVVSRTTKIKLLTIGELQAVTE
jgi:hypothetical protein